jgi:hypothetical protein
VLTPGNAFEPPRNGQVVALVDGAQVTPVIVINEGSAEITVPGFVKLTMWSQSVAGEKISVEDGSQLFIKQGSDIVLSGTGFQPVSPTKAWLFNSETLLGSGFATETGEVSGQYGVARSAKLGDQVFKFSGITADGSTITVAVGLTIITAAEDSPEANAPNNDVANQQFSAADILAISAVVFLLFLVLLLRRRKQTQV